MITEKLMGPGDWSIRLQADTTPNQIWSALNPDTGAFGHVLVTPTRVDPDALGDAGMLSASRYTGVYTGARSRDTIGGYGLSGWLGDPDGLGEIFESAVTGVDPTGVASDGTFTAWVRQLLPDALTEGTIHTIAGTFTASLRYLTPREGLDIVADYFDAAYRVNPDGTLDAGTLPDLFVSTPETVLMWTGGGHQRDLTGFHASGLDVQRDVEDYTTRVVLVGNQAGETAIVGTASGSTSYKDLQGNTLVRKRLVSAPEVTGNANTLASAQLGRFDEVRKAYRLSTNEWDLSGDVAVGDNIWVYDPRPDARLQNTARQVQFRGETIFPTQRRLRAVTWPVQKGMGVYFRDPDGAYSDLSEHVAFEQGAATLEVGAAPRRLTSTPSTSAAVQQQIGTLSAAAFDFDQGRTASNSATLGGTFTDHLTYSYTPPSAWGTFRLQALGWTNVQGLTSGDTVEHQVQIDGNNGTATSDNLAAADRSVVSSHDRTGLSGSVDVVVRLRNTTGSRGVASTSVVQVTAVRTS